ncbi:helix-turn-helix domain-containing protein [Nonomuraea fuscirosea]|uniref:helix-turn-helix domain-containing protein n=1 Tax=Nonomuraea fuscirosea TaxID=1291556 RepID=UPI00343E1CE7
MELKDQVRELRRQGKSPKEIARALKVSPSVVAPLVRAVAAEAAGAAESGDPAEAEVVGCWINAGWSEGLGFDRSTGWVDDAPDSGAGGAVSVLVARRHTWDRLSVCGYLADVHCLGVKNVIGPDVLNDRDLVRFREYFFGEYTGWQEVPIELVRQLVYGSIDYARTLGFEPDEGFTLGSELLGKWEGGSTITFGRDGKPFYREGPQDDGAKVVRMLRRRLADDEFGYVLAGQ